MKVKKSIKSAVDYFSLPLNVCLITGMHPLHFKRCNFFVRLFYSIYFWGVYLFFVVLNTVTKGIAIPLENNLDDLTDNISYMINHTMAAFKIALFMVKRVDLMRLVDEIEGEKFRHIDCCCSRGRDGFSANKLIIKAVFQSKCLYYIYSSFVVGLMLNSTLTAIYGTKKVVNTELINDLNTSENFFSEQFDANHNHQHSVRGLPFHAWYPFSTELSPIHEFTFAYQIVSIAYTAVMVMALDTMVVTFMIHLKVQFQLLSHNLRYVKKHAQSEIIANQTHSLETRENYMDINLTETMEKSVEKNVAHHQAIIKLSEDLESVFSYQLLLQFVCSLLAICALLWQVSSTPILSTKFASMLSYLGATAFQLFIYCWFGNDMMLESVSVANAAWDSAWPDIKSKRFRFGIRMITHRSQKVILITAGGFANVTLDTFTTILRAAYSCFAVLKKVEN